MNVVERNVLITAAIILRAKGHHSDADRIHRLVQTMMEEATNAD